MLLYKRIHTEGWKPCAIRGLVRACGKFPVVYTTFSAGAVIIGGRCLPQIPRRGKHKSLLTWPVTYAYSLNSLYSPGTDCTEITVPVLFTSRFQVTVGCCDSTQVLLRANILHYIYYIVCENLYCNFTSFLLPYIRLLGSWTIKFCDFQNIGFEGKAT